MDVLAPFVGILLAAVLWLAAFAAYDLLVRFVRHRRGRRRAVATPPPSWSALPPSWSLTLLVEVDHEAGVFRPSVQLRGSSLPSGARLRLEVVDDSGAIHISSERPLPPWAIGAEVALPAFTVPDGVTTEDVLRRHWDVVMEDWRGERQRWREHPAPSGVLNAEAELDLSGVPEI